MARFVMANRRAGKFSESDKVSARASVGMALSAMADGVNVDRDFEPEDVTSRRIVVFEADPAEVAAVSKSASPDVIIEPEILHWTSSYVPLQFQLGQSNPLASPFPTGSGNTLRISVTGAGSPLPHAEVTVAFRAFGVLTTTETKTTNASGRVTFTFSSIWTPQTAVVVPAGDFWTMVQFGPNGTVNVECPSLPQDGPIEWWHETMGIDRFRATRGRGIRVGVCDTGVGPNDNLDHVTDIGAFINNSHLPGQGEDVDAHGSHVCGIIGARPSESREYGGVSPGANLFSARVFGGPNSGAGNADIANAIDELSRNHQVDLINLSLGAAQGSAVIQDAIQDALERGSLCICAAGNSNGKVEFPGAFDQSVAVAALGLLGWGPAGSMASLRVPSTRDRMADDNLYHANFSCFGDEITCAAPGVGYISTVPARHARRPYAAFDGTSMASPAACGLTAALLSQSSDYRGLPRDLTRSGLARRILTRSCRDIGLASKYQGSGVPHI